MDYRELVRLLSGHNVYIQMHNFPDPDAIASAFGLQRFLKRFSISSRLCCFGRIDKLSAKRMLAAFDIRIYSGRELSEVSVFDSIITVDTHPAGANRTELMGEEVACIDHHPVIKNCRCRYEDIRPVGACSSIIAEYYQKAGVPMDQEVATALLYGIKMDTADFTRGVTALDTDMFAFSFKQADPEKLAALSANTIELEDLRAYGAAIDTIELVGRVGFACLPFPCPDAIIAVISDFILSVDVVDVAVIHSVRPDGLKFSVRSKRANVDAGVLIQKALSGLGSGGGHSYMAGGFIPANNLPLLGEDRNSTIKKRFLNVLMAIDKTVAA